MLKKPAPKIDPSKFENGSPLTFPEKVYNQLPDLLKAICLQIDDPYKRDVFLIGIITALSAAMSRCRFSHGSGLQIKEYSPHLLSFIIGGPGSGKGMAEYGALLIGKIEEEAQQKNKAASNKYKTDKLEFAREVEQRKKNKESFEGLVERKHSICGIFDGRIGQLTFASER